MRRTAQAVAGGVGVVATFAIVVCLWTGGRVFTAVPSAELAAMEPAGRRMIDAFAGSGLDDELGPRATIENTWALGWLPSGTGARFASVLTLVMGAAAAGGVTLAAIGYGSRRRGRGR